MLVPLDGGGQRDGQGIDDVRLEEFRKTWKWHHPLQEEQLRYSGATSVVQDVGFYHGGDELYELEGIPGIWHEACLERESHGEVSVTSCQNR